MSSNEIVANVDGLACSLCCYYSPATDTRKGWCQRYPPKQLCENGALFTSWPEVDEEDACGEWKPLGLGP